MAKLDCKHYDAELDCCKLHSDWADPMPILTPCVEGPCHEYSATVRCARCKNAELVVDIIGNPHLFCTIDPLYCEVDFDETCRNGEMKEES